MALANHISQSKGQRVTTGKGGGRWPVVTLSLALLSALAIGITLWLIFFYAPIDAIQKEPQLIFYLHVPMAWIGMLSYGILAVAGIIYLVRPAEHWDWLARASAEVGMVFLTVALICGSLWGKPIWGAWWVWDPKLTATLLLWFMYIGYLLLRSYWGRNEESGRGGAVVGIVGVIDVPIIYLSVQWWRGQHPTPTTGLPAEAVTTLWVSMLAFTLLYACIMILAYQLQRMQSIAHRLRALVE